MLVRFTHRQEDIGVDHQLICSIYLIGAVRRTEAHLHDADRHFDWRSPAIIH